MIPEWLQHPDPSIYLSNNYVVLDFETSNLNKGDPRHIGNSLVMSCFAVGSDHVMYNGKVKVIWGNQFHQEELLKAIEQADFIVAHNTKFELQWLTRCGLKLTDVLPYCTLLGKYVEDGNRRRPRDLNSVAKHFGLGAKSASVELMIHGGICPTQIPRSLLQRYCVQDVLLTEQVFLRQRELLSNEGLLAVAFTRNIFTPVLADIELNGMQLDVADVNDYYDAFTAKHAESLHELDTFAEGINWKSGTQVAKFLYGDLGFHEITSRGVPVRNKATKQFPNGLPKTDRTTLASLRATTAKQRRFVKLYDKHMKLNKSISTYLKLFKEACDFNGGMLLGRFNQAVTQTHRLSSSGPNFQNFDRNFKVLFTSRRKQDGWIIGERDAAQLEFRTAAYVGQDKQAYTDISEGIDVHALTASIIGVGRTDAKSHTFKPLYGGTSGTKDERRYYEEFKRKYSDIADTQETWVQEALMCQLQVLPTGLKFYWPKIKLNPSGYIEGNTNVRNYPIQNLATAEIIPIGVTYFWHHLKDNNMNTLLVNTVHDSLITDEDPEESEELDSITRHAFSTEVIDYLDTVYDIQFDIPLDIETELSTNWSWKCPKIISK